MEGYKSRLQESWVPEGKVLVSIPCRLPQGTMCPPIKPCIWLSANIVSVYYMKQLTFYMILSYSITLSSPFDIKTEKGGGGVGGRESSSLLPIFDNVLEQSKVTVSAQGGKGGKWA